LIDSLTELTKEEYSIGGQFGVLQSIKLISHALVNYIISTLKM